MSRLWRHTTVLRGFICIDVGYRTKVYSDFRCNAGLCALQSDIGRSDIRLIWILLITDHRCRPMLARHLHFLEPTFPPYPLPLKKNIPPRATPILAPHSSIVQILLGFLLLSFNNFFLFSLSFIVSFFIFLFKNFFLQMISVVKAMGEEGSLV